MALGGAARRMPTMKEISIALQIISTIQSILGNSSQGGCNQDIANYVNAEKAKLIPFDKNETDSVEAMIWHINNP